MLIFAIIHKKPLNPSVLPFNVTDCSIMDNNLGQCEEEIFHRFDVRRKIVIGRAMYGSDSMLYRRDHFAKYCCWLCMKYTVRKILDKSINMGPKPFSPLRSQRPCVLL